MSKIIVVVGPNGSGKSTIINKLATEGQNLPDLYICPDIIAKEYEEIKDEKERYKIAMDEAESQRREAVKQKESFILETLATTKEKRDFLEYAKKEGYTVELIFVGTSDPKINLERVAKRAEEGGHNVPPEKTVSRYYKCMDVLPSLIELSDSCIIFDNSREAPILVALKDQEWGTVMLNKEFRGEWPDKYIKEPLRASITKDLKAAETILFINSLEEEKTSIFSFFSKQKLGRVNRKKRGG